MSLRKIAVLLAAAGLAVGLIGGGVGAQFTGQVSAQQNLQVGTFGCKITDHNLGTLGNNDTSLYYDAGTITSSAPGTAPLNFTVVSTGTIPVVLNIMAMPVALPFHELLAPAGAVTLSAGGSQAYTAGISWPELNNSNLGKSASIAYVVNCNEVGANPVTSVSFSAVGGGAGSNVMNDTFTGSGFLANAPLTIFMLREGSPTPFDLNAFYGGVSADGTGAFLKTTADDCSVTPGGGPSMHVDMPAIIWASDGTRSAIGTGVVPCSQY